MNFYDLIRLIVARVGWATDAEHAAARAVVDAQEAWDAATHGPAPVTEVAAPAPADAAAIDPAALQSALIAMGVTPAALEAIKSLAARLQ